MGKTFSDNAKGILVISYGKIQANKAFSGPVEIARKVYGGEWIWMRFWASTGFVSIALAFMNLLPIPALDGGHVVLLIGEMIKGKPLGDKFMERAQIVGFVLAVIVDGFCCSATTHTFKGCNALSPYDGTILQFMAYH